MIVQESNIKKRFGTAIILAGGKSSRMGFDKQFLKIDNKKIMDKLIDNLKKEFEEIIIVTNKPEEYNNEKYKVTTDIIRGKGPLSGIHAGLKKSTCQYSFVVACDMPNINMEYIRYMKEYIGGKTIDGCVTYLGNHVEPFHGFYSRNIINHIEECLIKNRRSVNRFIGELNFLYIEESEGRKFSPDLSMFSNLNTQEDIDIYMEDLRKKIK